ncbi:unannotated protein [freshwater metagenome]|uniref:Unannotated protein n=1 Tax=freshwater metagenome TaxID=449393 RepID=A0A6J7JQQ1_9ZZZZ
MTPSGLRWFPNTIGVAPTPSLWNRATVSPKRLRASPLGMTSKNSVAIVLTITLA